MKKTYSFNTLDRKASNTYKNKTEAKQKSKKSAGEIILIILEWFLIIEGIGVVASGLGPVGLFFVAAGLILMLCRKKKK